jgi:predicted oxidoreductase
LEFSALNPEPAFDGVLDFAISHQMTPLAWSPLAGGKLADAVSVEPAALRVTKKLDELATVYGTTRVAVALAFVIRHPSNPIPIIGTQNPSRIAAASDALRVNLSRTDWYALVVAAQGKPLP